MNLAIVLLALQPPPIIVGSLPELRSVAINAKPGSTILVKAGDYQGGLFLSDLHGQSGKPIIIAGQDPKNPPRFIGGIGVQFSKVSHLELRDLRIQNITANGLNIDDGGEMGKPSHHVTLKRIHVSDLPKGNHDGIKLSGLKDFRVEDCTVERWGGSGIDMVGCHQGVIEGCVFRDGGDSGVQAKGGSSDIVVSTSRFKDYGQRGVNLGGSTGADYFRPPLASMPKDGKYEARNLRVEGCTFVGGVAPLAFVGVDGATVRFNTVVDPGKWVMRILQETRTDGFLPSRNGVFTDNLVVFGSNGWSEGGVNIGPGTQPDSFQFSRNFWFCRGNPTRSTPRLPTPEKDGVHGKEPLVKVDAEGRVTLPASSPAAGFGAGAIQR